jgi:hypothetical protein
MELTRTRIEGIMREALGELDAITRDFPYLARANESCKTILREALRRSTAIHPVDHLPVMHDDHAMRIMAEKAYFVACNLGLPLSVQSATEDAAKDAGRWDPKRHTVHEVFANLQAMLVSMACEILQRPVPVSPLQYSVPTIPTAAQYTHGAITPEKLAELDGKLIAS